ncbi:MAG: RnfABCDGE type electron transport complex subunit B [Candidatus Cloacimonetes bacterium]|nr:RnfABCDGE type electron transport complex subunit B [Candidatus Cloacimonadota bacterium]
MSAILIPVAIIGGLGLAFGFILAFASRVFHVEIDPKIEQIIEALPGANCGACGRPGCAAYAEAIALENEDITKCAPGGADTIKAICEIMGMKAEARERRVAVIHCQSGGNDNTHLRYDYQGIATCKAAVELSKGPNLCNYGCVFHNDCITACLFDAIHLDDNGMRVIDKEKCTACGACVKACPRNLIELVAISRKVHILCTSHDKGKEAKMRCGNNTACISCGLCVKKCPVGAIEMQDMLAVIDYDKCISCGLCATVCPTKAIIDPLAGTRGKAVIHEEDCIGCTICAKNCPVDAISGELKQPHTVDPDKCIGCEICVEKCPKKCIEMQR